MRKWCWLLLLTACACKEPRAETALEAARSESQRTKGDVARARSAILITIDTLRADVLGCYGGKARSPAIDQMAERGWLFENAYAASMLTNPSHVSLFTSLYPRDHGVYDNESGVRDGMRTLASELLRRGFRTGAVINFMHLNPNVSNLGDGFDRVIPAVRQERRAPEVAERALDLVDQFGDQRFFLWVHFTDPHAPYDPPSNVPLPQPRSGPRTPMARARHMAPRFQRQNPWFSKAFRAHAHTQALTDRYVAEVSVADAGVGLLMAGLEERGRNDVLVIATSDHGENLGEHELYFHHGGLYRETVHVPLIMVGPGIQPQRIAGQTESVDVAPTVLEALGVPRWEPMRGKSLIDLVVGRREEQRFVFSEHTHGQLIAVRSREATLILHRKSSKQFPSYPFVAGKREFYDRVFDPFERRVLSGDNPIAGSLEEALQKHLGRGLRLEARRALNQDRAALRALGYVE